MKITVIGSGAWEGIPAPFWTVLVITTEGIAGKIMREYLGKHKLRYATMLILVLFAVVAAVIDSQQLIFAVVALTLLAHLIEFFNNRLRAKRVGPALKRLVLPVGVFVALDDDRG
jgi:hypothetical protein